MTEIFKDSESWLRAGSVVKKERNIATEMFKALLGTGSWNCRKEKEKDCQDYIGRDELLGFLGHESGSSVWKGIESEKGLLKEVDDSEGKERVRMVPREHV